MRGFELLPVEIKVEKNEVIFSPIKGLVGNKDDI